MSDDDKQPQPGCYWYQQGKCFLSEVREDWVYEILARTPEARKDLLECTDLCPDVHPDYVAFAEKNLSVRSEKQANDAWLSNINEYVDNHRQIGRNVFREPPKTEEDDDE